MANLNSERFQAQGTDGQRKVLLLVFLIQTIAMIVAAFYVITTFSVYPTVALVIIVFLFPLVNALARRATKKQSAS